MQEAAHLQADLRRAKIEPYGWIINCSLAATSTTNPVLSARARAEIDEMRAVKEQHARRVFAVPWTAEDPTGVDALRRLMAPNHLAS